MFNDTSKSESGIFLRLFFVVLELHKDCKRTHTITEFYLQVNLVYLA